MLEVTEENFEKEVLQSKTPVVVDFWAPWCRPCQAIAPVFEKLSNEFNGKLKFAKLNVDNHAGIASQFDVRGIPTMVIFKNSQEANRIVGQMSESVLRDKFKSVS